MNDPRVSRRRARGARSCRQPRETRPRLDSRGNRRSTFESFFQRAQSQSSRQAEYVRRRCFRREQRGQVPVDAIECLRRVHRLSQRGAERAHLTVPIEMIRPQVVDNSIETLAARLVHLRKDPAREQETGGQFSSIEERSVRRHERARRDRRPIPDCRPVSSCRRSRRPLDDRSAPRFCVGHGLDDRHIRAFLGPAVSVPRRHGTGGKRRRPAEGVPLSRVVIGARLE